MSFWKITCILSISLVVIVISVILCCILIKGKKEAFTQSEYPIYITTLDNDVSKRRAAAQAKVLKLYKFNNLRYNPALHWKHDGDKIVKKYPYIIKNCKRFKDRPGAYGLTASFIQFLETNNKKSGMIGWMEDDVIPAGAETFLDKKKDIVNQINKQYKIDETTVNRFNSIYKKAMLNLPKSGYDVYFFGHTHYCNEKSLRRKYPESSKLWIRIDKDDKYRAGGPGTSFIMFTKNSITKILDWVKNNNVDLPIDMLFLKLIKENVITGWEINYSLTENQMFYGFFEQMGTYCDSRQNNTIDV